MNQQPPDRLLRSFERYLRATNRSERTVGNYLENLHQVEAFLRPRGVRLRDATRAVLEEFLADLLARRSAATAATSANRAGRRMTRLANAPSSTCRTASPYVSVRRNTAASPSSAARCRNAERTR